MDFDGAKADFDKATELDSGFAKKCEKRRKNAIVTGNYAKGIVYFTHAIKLDPQNENHYSERAFTHLCRGEVVDFILDMARSLNAAMKYGVRDET